ncbi:putative ABC transporter, partial [Balamuthia mandrillaris]
MSTTTTEAQPLKGGEKEGTAEKKEADTDNVSLRRKEEDNRTPEEVIGTVKRHKVIMKQDFGEDLTLLEFESIDCDGAPVIDAFPSVGVVSILTGMQLIKDMKLPLIGVLTSPLFSSMCAVTNEQPAHSARLYGDRRLVVFICENELPKEAVATVVECIFSFALRHKSPMIYTIEGIPSGDKIKLPSGEEVQLSAAGEEEEELDTGVEKIIIDDTALAELYLKQKKKKEEDEKKQKEAEGQKEEAKDGKQQEKKEAATKAKGKKKEEDKKKGKGKRRSAEEADEEKEEEEESKEELAERLYGDKIHYITTDIQLARKLRSMGLVPVVDGTIPGVTGGLMASAPLTTQEVTAILAPTSTVLPNTASAVDVLKLLAQLLPDISLSSTQELEKVSG